MKSKLLILYHRTPYEEYLKNGEIIFKENSRPNGIIALLKSVLSSENSAMWIAGSKLISKSDVHHTVTIDLVDSDSKCLLKRVAISEEELHDFYHTTSKEGFWPILHSFPEKFNYSKVNWENFLEINKRFAEAAIEESDEDTVIWIHDYNLWLVPHFIRKKRPDAKIAFFLHTPFPAADIFNILPWRKQIIESLLSCDLITFAIPRYIENFASVASSNFPVVTKLKEKVNTAFSSNGGALSEPYLTSEIIFGHHHIKLVAFPVGTDCEFINKTLTKKNIRHKILKIKEKVAGNKLIFAASRLDYIKGTDYLLEAYLRLLDRQKDLIGKITLMVVAVEPANGILIHDELRIKIKGLVDEINSKYLSSSWSPVVYSEEALSFEDMICWYAAADIMWVPSLRDGTNLVCKEYLAVKGSNPGILILSEFLGAAIELPEALIFNPYSSQSMDNAIDTALLMPISEQISRNTTLHKKILLSVPKLWAAQLSVLNSNQLKSYLTTDLINK